MCVCGALWVDQPLLPQIDSALPAEFHCCCPGNLHHYVPARASAAAADTPRSRCLVMTEPRKAVGCRLDQCCQGPQGTQVSVPDIGLTITQVHTRQPPSCNHSGSPATCLHMPVPSHVQTQDVTHENIDQWQCCQALVSLHGLTRGPVMPCRWYAKGTTPRGVHTSGCQTGCQHASQP